MRNVRFNVGYIYWLGESNELPDSLLIKSSVSADNLLQELNERVAFLIAHFMEPNIQSSPSTRVKRAQLKWRQQEPFCA